MTFNLLYIFFLLIFFSSYTILVYKSYAEKLNLPIGSLFDKVLFVTVLGTLALTVSFLFNRIFLYKMVFSNHSCYPRFAYFWIFSSYNTIMDAIDVNYIILSSANSIIFYLVFSFLQFSHFMFINFDLNHYYRTIKIKNKILLSNK